MSEINHQWNGSVLTVTSDSGASSADLRGPKGDTGPRGPQGPAGVIYDSAGKVVVDLSPFYTMDEVDEKFEQYSPDLNAYATKAYVDGQIVDVVTGGTVNLDNYYTKGEVDKNINLENYYTKSEMDTTMANYKVDVDGQSIVRQADGSIKTAVGGYMIPDIIYSDRQLNVALSKDAANDGQGNYCAAYFIPTPTVALPHIITNYTEYHAKVVFSDGFVDEFKFITYVKSGGGGDDWHSTRIDANYDTIEGNERVSTLGFVSYEPAPEGEFSHIDVGVSGYYGANHPLKDITITEFYLSKPGAGGGLVVPMNGEFIPVDETTIALNDDGLLTATGVILTAPNGTRYQLTVSNTGALSATAV